jgi:hypothetical protein
MIRCKSPVQIACVLVAGLTGACGLVDFAGDAQLCNSPPARVGLRNERVIVRHTDQYSQTERRFYLDRVRYLEEGDELSPNRVVVAFPGSPELQQRLDELGAARGDTLRVDTRFEGTVRATISESAIPRFAGNEGSCIDGAIVALHALTNVSR